MKRIGDKIYHTSAWRKLRQYYYGKQHGVCERCGRPGDIVHHKIHIDETNVDDPSITLNEDNLELLCHECHNKEHKQVHSPVREGFAFDEKGNLIQLLQLKKIKRAIPPIVGVFLRTYLSERIGFCDTRVIFP